MLLTWRPSKKFWDDLKSPIDALAPEACPCSAKIHAERREGIPTAGMIAGTGGQSTDMAVALL